MSDDVRPDSVTDPNAADPSIATDAPESAEEGGEDVQRTSEYFGGLGASGAASLRCPENAYEDARDDAPEIQGTSESFGGLGARGAAQLRWAQERARKEAQAQGARDDVLIVTVPVQVGAIITALAGDAKKGNVQSARELRAYLTEYPPQDETDIAALDKKTRQSLIGELLLLVRQESTEGLATPPETGEPTEA